MKLQISLPRGVCINTLGEVKRSSSLKVSKDKVKYMNGIEFKGIRDSDMDEITRFLMNEAAVKQSEFLKLSKETRIRD